MNRVSVSTLEEDAHKYFATVKEEMVALTDQVIHFITEDEKAMFEEYSSTLANAILKNSKRLIESVAPINTMAKSVKADKTLLERINRFEKDVEEGRKFALAEAAALKLVPEKPGANKKFKLAEMDRVTNEIMDEYLEKYAEQLVLISHELKSSIEARERKQKLTTISIYTIVVLLNAGTYIVFGVLWGAVGLH